MQRQRMEDFQVCCLEREATQGCPRQLETWIDEVEF